LRNSLAFELGMAGTHYLLNYTGDSRPKPEIPELLALRLFTAG
jgi:hypothetical protein